uniref:Capsular polysaccharide ABC transporter, ATP-binding protein KpsT n=1 Tax=uncultured Thiotrichaceae bacterium TaxID=298394 RepID=A0A6S6U929_9GAMM|nr:MAG: Capsular polysaccharide ABC transporter, ATP-binding protein KpsT [uncultured Thiotrichaceae bacterium]
MIEFIDVSKFYPVKHGRKNILDQVSFQFPENQNIGVLGRNGAGKSTLLRLIAGSELPDTGQIIRKGKFSWPLGFGGGFNGELSGEENLRFVSRIYDADLTGVISFVQGFSELGNALKEPVRTYSSGMRAKLAFGLSLAIDFDVYLIDEVMAVGDAQFRNKSRAAFEERRQTSSLIVVSHDMKTIRDYSDVIIILDQQRLKVYDDIDMAIETYKTITGVKV